MMKKCEKDSKFDEKGRKKVAAASCCAVFGRVGEEKREGRQTESRRKLDLTRADGWTSWQNENFRLRQTEDAWGRRKDTKIKRPKLDLVFYYNTKQARYYQTNRKTPYNFHCNSQNQHTIQIYYYKTSPRCY